MIKDEPRIAIVLDDKGYKENKVFGWIPLEHLVEGKNIEVELPNGIKKQFEKGWLVDKNYIPKLFERYSALELTDLCTVKCSNFCAAPKTKKGCNDNEFVTLDFAKEMAKAICLSEPYKKGIYDFLLNPSEFGITHVSKASPSTTICITGGEPTCHPHYDEILSEFSKIKKIYNDSLNIVFATNLTNITDNFFEAIAKKGIELQCSYNTKLKGEFVKIVKNEGNYGHLKEQIPPLKGYNGQPEHALFETIKYAQLKMWESCPELKFSIIDMLFESRRSNKLEAWKNSSYMVTRITEAKDEIGKLEKEFYDHLASHGMGVYFEVYLDYVVPKVIYYPPRDLHYVTQKAAAGYAINVADSVEVPLRNLGNYRSEIYIKPDGRIIPHMAWNGAPFGYTGIL